MKKAMTILPSVCLLSVRHLHNNRPLKGPRDSLFAASKMSTLTRAAAKRRKLIQEDNDTDPPTAATPKTSPPNTTNKMITADQLRQIIENGKNNNGSNRKCQITYLTPNKTSWILFCKRWMPCPDEATFEQEWALHPPERHLLKVFGRVVAEKRWSTSWGVSYAYSGTTNPGRAIPLHSRVAHLLEIINEWVEQPHGAPTIRYNACLQNWYEPNDTIGRHADDEKDMVKGSPIFSLSWGGTRRFVMRPKKNTTARQEFWLEDGDLLVMGGTTQDTHYHEVPQVRKTMDPPTTRRVNWTLRAFY